MNIQNVIENAFNVCMDLGAETFEPSLRHIIRQYYMGGAFSKEQADELTSWYIEQFTAHCLGLH